MTAVVPLEKAEAVYGSSALYPSAPYTVRTTTGLVGTTHCVLVTVTLYPVRYAPQQRTAYVSDQATVSVSYQEPPVPVTFGESYDIMVIAPEEYTSALQPLVDHKVAKGLPTTLVTLESIAAGTYAGRDDAEDVKLAIKEAVELQGVHYVLLVGGMRKTLNDWICPVRYTNNHVGADFEYGVLSDLYFADIYKDNGTAFEDWDSNGNDVFAEYTTTSKDIIDGAPDVYVGRLACRSEAEVTTMVDKIIAYEATPADPSWYQKMVLVGGDTYPDSGPGGYEAEIDTNLSGSYMTGFSLTRLFASLGTLTGQEDFEEAINGGCGFIHCAGHANPSILVTHPPENESKITIMQVYNLPPVNAIYALFYQGLGLSGFFQKLREPWMPKISNGEKLPVVVVGGCHNSQFNTTLDNIRTQGFSHAYGWGEYVPKSWSWWLTVHEKGGAIATMGNSGLGMGLPGFEYPNGLDGWLLPRFFYHVGQLGVQTVGAAHSAAIADYVAEFDINIDDADRQMVEQWVLLGDPSLRMGGYE
jgi:hypothetical protein